MSKETLVSLQLTSYEASVLLGALESYEPEHYPSDGDSARALASLVRSQLLEFEPEPSSLSECFNWDQIPLNRPGSK